MNQSTLEEVSYFEQETVAQLSLPIIDQTTASRSMTRRERNTVAKTLRKVRQIHEELNGLLYARPQERPAVHSPKDAYDVIYSFLEPLDHEELWIIVLDTRNRIMQLVTLYKGGVSSAQVRVAEIFRQAVIFNAPSIILAHNHPSGDPDPSPDDVSLTRIVIEAGKLMDIEVLDHIIIGRGKFVSLKERKLAF